MNLKVDDSEEEEDDDLLGNIADELTKEDGSRSKETYSDHDGEPAFLAYMADRAHEITNQASIIPLDRRPSQMLKRGNTNANMEPALKKLQS